MIYLDARRNLLYTDAASVVLTESLVRSRGSGYSESCLLYYSICPAATCLSATGF